MPVPLRIIYVDDDPQLLEIGRIFLEQNRDFSVETIDSASAAIELLQHEQYDVIVSDYQMPGMNGIEFLQYLRSAGSTTPFIIFTGKGREEIVIQALNEGADFYLQKGGDPESQFAELTHKIRITIQKRKAEEALLEKTSELDRFFNSSLDLLAIADTEGYFRRLNPEWERTLGYPLSELEGRRFLDLVHPEDLGPTLDYLSTLRSQEEVLNFSNRYQHKDGSYRWIEWRSYPYGEFLYASARDITERKQAEAALRESTERYRNVVEDQTEFISRFLPDGTHIFVNDAYCRYFGMTRSEILGHRFSPIIPLEDKERITLFFKALTPDNPVGTIEHRIIMPDGTTRWQRWSDRAIFDPSGNIIEYQSVGRDVTEIKRTEEALRKSETKYRSLFDNAVLGIFLSTPEGKYIEINAAFARIAGYDDPEEMKSAISDIQKQLYIHPEDRKTINTLLSTAGEIKNFETEIRHRDGHSIWISINAKAVRDRGGNLLAYEGTIEEITARRIAERALNRKNEELFAANELLAASEEELRHQLDEIRSRDLMLARSEESFRAQYQNNPIAIFTWKKKGDDFVLVDFNKAADTLTKGRVKDYIGKFASDLYLSRPEIISEVRQCYFEQSTISKELISEHFLPGRYVKTTATFTPPDMILVHLEDITDSKVAEEALHHQSKTLSILNGIIVTANKADNLPDLLSSILEESLRLMDFDAGGIYLVNPATRTADVIRSKNLPPEFLVKIQTVPVDTDPYDRVFIRKEPIFTENYAKINPDLSKKFGFQSAAIIPLLSKRETIGAMNITSTRRYMISEEEKQALISIGSELGSTVERIIAEEEAKVASKNLETLFNSIDEMVFVLDLQGNIISVNDTVQKRLLYSSEELTGMNVLVLHVPERRDEALRIVQGMVAGTIDCCPVPVVSKDGTRIEVETKVTRGLWNNQEVLIAVTRDVTERKIAEEALRESEEKYRTIIDNMEDMFYRTDNEENFTMVSPSGARLAGYDTPDQLIGMKITHHWENPGDREKFLEALRKNGSVTGYPVTIRSRDGKIHYLRVSSHFYKDKNGTVQGVEGTIHDITELQYAENALKLANKKLNLLTSITRHDINNQLTVLQGYLGIIGKKQADPALQEYFQKASASSQRISSMIRFTKEYEEIGINAPAWHDCRMIIESAAQEVPLGNITIRSDFTIGFEVFADPLIVKVFYNLMDNAVRYGGEITTIRFSVEKSGDDHLIICEDDGEGISENVKDKIFEREFGNNTGMGLFLSREILSITGITIKETGEPGNGARFEMTVPKGTWRIGGMST